MTKFEDAPAIMTKLAREYSTEVNQALRAAAHKYGRSVVRTAKAMLGNPDSYGEFGWEPLTDDYEERKVDEGFPADAPGLREGEMRAGFFYHIRTESGAQRRNIFVDFGNVDDTYYFFDMGTIKQPPRPVLGPAMRLRQRDLAGFVREAMRAR